MLKKTQNMIIKARERKDSNHGYLTKKYLNEKGYFFLECREDCILTAKNFSGSETDFKLKNMFFRDSHLKIIFKNDHAIITAHGAMDCKIGDKELVEDIPFRLDTGHFQEFLIDNIKYTIEYRGFSRKTWAGD